MAENEIFFNQLRDAIKRKTEWFDTVRLPELLETYRVIQGCTKNLKEVFLKKNILLPDPYKTSKAITEIVVPETSNFTEKEASSVFSHRFFDYDEMLDFICVNVNFSTESLTIPKIKKLLEFNDVFQWNILSSGSIQHSNTKALSDILNEARVNTPDVIVSMINDCVERNSEALTKINVMLKEVVGFEKEIYKFDIRVDIIGHSEFEKTKALSSPDAEMAEIKRVYARVKGRNPFYTEFVKEIIQEDQSPNKSQFQMNVLKTLEFREKANDSVSAGHDTLMNITLALASLAPTLTQLKNKFILNLDLVFKEKNSFVTTLINFFRKLFNIKRSDRICAIQIMGTSRYENLVADDFIELITNKEKLFSSIASKGQEYAKLDALPDDKILAFINKQHADCQSMYMKFNALDEYFKHIVDVSLVPRIKGTQIERTAMRNTLVNVNNKKEEYSKDNTTKE